MYQAPINFDNLKVGSELRKRGYAIERYIVREILPPATNGGWTQSLRSAILEGPDNPQQWANKERIWESERGFFELSPFVDCACPNCGLQWVSSEMSVEFARDADAGCPECEYTEWEVVGMTPPETELGGQVEGFSIRDRDWSYA